jgi:hypothetical protein
VGIRAARRTPITGRSSGIFSPFRGLIPECGHPHHVIHRHDNVGAPCPARRNARQAPAHRVLQGSKVVTRGPLGRTPPVDLVHQQVSAGCLGRHGRSQRRGGRHERCVRVEPQPVANPAEQMNLGTRSGIPSSATFHLHHLLRRLHLPHLRPPDRMGTIGHPPRPSRTRPACPQARTKASHTALAWHSAAPSWPSRPPGEIDTDGGASSLLRRLSPRATLPQRRSSGLLPAWSVSRLRPVNRDTFQVSTGAAVVSLARLPSTGRHSRYEGPRSGEALSASLTRRSVPDMGFSVNRPDPSKCSAPRHRPVCGPSGEREIRGGGAAGAVVPESRGSTATRSSRASCGSTRASRPPAASPGHVDSPVFSGDLQAHSNDLLDARAIAPRARTKSLPVAR